MTALRATFHPTPVDHRVTSLELLFDIVFIFAITQIGHYVGTETTFGSMLRGLLLLGLMWWAWSSYAWLGNHVQADRGTPRLIIFTSIVLMVVVGLALPGVWGPAGETPAGAVSGGGLSAPLVFAICLSLVRVVHLGSYWLAAGEDSALRLQVVRAGIPVLLAAGLLVAGALLGGRLQLVLWLLALLVDYAGVYLSGSDWRLSSAAHFAERYGLMVIIALGESFVAIGYAAAESVMTWYVLLAAALTAVTGIGLYWAYFDVLAPAAEHALVSRQGVAQVRVARDGYSYLHLPFVGGIVFTAIGIAKVNEAVADGGAGAPLPVEVRVCLLAGVATALTADAVFRLRSGTAASPVRLLATVVLLAAIPLTAGAPAVSGLLALAGTLLALVLIEAGDPGPTRRSTP